MSVYIKSSGIATDNVDLITKLRDFLVSNGFVLELYGDNIINSVNLGKRLHLSKNSVFYNFACVLNNSTAVNQPTWTSAGVSEIAGNCSLTLNTSNTWFSNNPDSSIARAEIKTNCSYWFYLNDKNLIIVIKYAANKYTFLSLGEAESLTVDKVVLQSSSCNNILTSGELNKVGLFIPLKTGYFINSTYYNENNSRIKVNHFNNNSEIPAFNISTSANDRALVNRSDNIFNGTSILMPIKYYTRITSPVSEAYYQPTFKFKNAFMINFKNHTAEQTLEIGTKQYDVFPFYQKESPQLYSNTQSWGMGLAIKIAE